MNVTLKQSTWNPVVILSKEEMVQEYTKMQYLIDDALMYIDAYSYITEDAGNAVSDEEKDGFFAKIGKKIVKALNALTRWINNLIGNKSMEDMDNAEKLEAICKKNPAIKDRVVLLVTNGLLDLSAVNSMNEFIDAYSSVDKWADPTKLSMLGELILKGKTAINKTSLTFTGLGSGLLSIPAFYKGVKEFKEMAKEIKNWIHNKLEGTKVGEAISTFNQNFVAKIGLKKGKRKSEQESENDNPDSSSDDNDSGDNNKPKDKPNNKPKDDSNDGNDKPKDDKQDQDNSKGDDSNDNSNDENNKPKDQNDKPKDKPNESGKSDNSDSSGDSKDNSDSNNNDNHGQNRNNSNDRRKNSKSKRKKNNGRNRPYREAAGDDNDDDYEENDDDETTDDNKGSSLMDKARNMLAELCKIIINFCSKVETYLSKKFNIITRTSGKLLDTCRIISKDLSKYGSWEKYEKAIKDGKVELPEGTKYEDGKIVIDANKIVNEVMGTEDKDKESDNKDKNGDNSSKNDNKSKNNSDNSNDNDDNDNDDEEGDSDES